jgi:inositol phosphorylceramide mannosyltransferase catalytic subunit
MTTLLIPKLFHWIWFGPRPLPEQYRCWIEGWLELHPGWEHFLWTDANRPTFINEVQFQAADSFAQKADIARYEIVYLYGGVYVDTDTECLRPLTTLGGLFVCQRTARQAARCRLLVMNQNFADGL